MGSYYYLGVGSRSISYTDKEQAQHWSVLKQVREARTALRPDGIIDLLDEDAVYESQSTLEPLCGKKHIAKYLRARFKLLNGRRSPETICLVFATVDLPQCARHPCLIFEADRKRLALWVMTLRSEGLIARFDILTVAPHPNEAAALQAPGGPS